MHHTSEDEVSCHLKKFPDKGQNFLLQESFFFKRRNFLLVEMKGMKRKIKVKKEQRLEIAKEKQE